VELGGSSLTTEDFNIDVEIVDALSTNRLFVSGVSYTRTDPRLVVALSSLKSKIMPFRINWMILRRLFIPQAGT